METRIHIHDHKPATMTAKMIGSVCWLEIKQGEDVISLAMPARMDAAARMIAEAFNAHMHGGPITKLTQTGLTVTFPTGAAMSASAALAVVAAASVPFESYIRLSDGTELFGAAADAAWTDLDAARAIEQRDIP